VTLAVQQTASGVQFEVKAVPGSSRDRIVAVHGTALKVTVAAPAERGQANARIVALLAEALGVARSDVELVTGAAHARKQVRVRGLTAARLLDRLQILMP
jgi:uncharacterized protein (TIGR00251 family)